MPQRSFATRPRLSPQEARFRPLATARPLAGAAAVRLRRARPPKSGIRAEEFVPSRFAPHARRPKIERRFSRLVIGWPWRLRRCRFCRHRAAALDAAIVKGLRELDLGARLEQRCDYEAMTRIAKDKKRYRARPRRGRRRRRMRRSTATRSRAQAPPSARKGKWYRLSYVCKTSADHMDVLDFNYKIGDAIPEADWEKYGLWE